jgi:hypothetical protein
MEEIDAMELRDAAPPVAELLLSLPCRNPVVSLSDDDDDDDDEVSARYSCPHLLQLPGTPLTTHHKRYESSVSEISITSDDDDDDDFSQTNDEQECELQTSFPLIMSQEIQDMEHSLENIRIYNHERKESFTSVTSGTTQNTLEFFNSLIEQHKQRQPPQQSNLIQKSSFHRRVSNDTLPPIQAILSNHKNNDNNNQQNNTPADWNHWTSWNVNRNDGSAPSSAAQPWMWITGQN